jgi:hypothetical protein
MDRTFEIAISLMDATLLLGPPIAFGIFLGIRRWWPRAQFPATVIATALLIFAFAVDALKLNFTSTLANIVLLAVGYCAYYVLAASSLQIKTRLVRYLVLFVAALPIAAGYVLATIGGLGLAFIIGDYTAAPNHVEEMRPHLTCEITRWGSAVSASGYTVKLYQSWPSLSFIRREVAALPVTESGTIGGEPDQDKTCTDALNTYEQKGPA